MPSIHPFTSALRAIAFWTAVVLPLAYVPVLGGFTPAELGISIVAVHAVCLFVGHEHTPRSGSTPPARR